MFSRLKNIVTRCFPPIKPLYRGAESFVFALLFFISPSFADHSVVEINADYLNSLTNPKITWEDASASDFDIVFINGAYYKYTYHQPVGYGENNSRQGSNFNESDVQSVVFKGAGGSSRGGAIYNSGEFNYPIIADFIGNYAQRNGAYGGAIYNDYSSTIGNITGDFIGNYAQADNYSAFGGAIYTYGTIGGIIGDFSGNYVQGNGAYGGAIYNNYSSTIGNITGDFIGNYAQADNYSAQGGAIYNSGNIENITGDFSGNYAQGSSSAEGGAIYNNYGTIGGIIGDFSGNYAQGSSSARGGAIYNDGTIGGIIGDFSGNYVQADNGEAHGGAIYNYSTIGNITGDFSGNYAQGNDAYGGAIYNSPNGTIGNITGDFFGNYAQADNGEAHGGAIYISGSEISLINSSFYNNYAKGKDAKGGAIASLNYRNYYGDYYYPILNITADNGESIFSGNYTETINDDRSTTKESNAIYQSYKGTINFNAVNNGLIRFDDKITGDGTISFLEENGATITKGSDGNYVMDFGGSTLTSRKTIYGDFLSLPPEESGLPEYMTEDEVLGLLNGEGGDVPVIPQPNRYGNQDYVINVEGILILLTQQEDRRYLFEAGYLIQEHSGTINITGDASSQVVFNETVDAGFIDISGTNVFANKGAFRFSTTRNGGVLNIGAGATLENAFVSDGGKVNITSGAVAERVEVNVGGVLHVASDGVANNTTINFGGSLEADVRARLNNLFADDGAILNINSGSILTGNIIINAGAEMGGSYDYSSIFKDDLNSGSLSLVGGMNSVITEDSLINNVANKKLNITSGDYVIGGENQFVSGWDSLTVSDANVKVEGVIDMGKSSNVINIDARSVLDLAGHSPLITTIIGSVNNAGTLNFHHDGDSSDDVTNIFGNYKAFNGANMIIDLNPNDDVNPSDLMIVDGDVEGTTGVSVYLLSDGTTHELIKFVDAPNDNPDTGAYFTITRVEREFVDRTDDWKIVHQDNAWHITSADNPITSSDGYGSADTGDLDIDNTDRVDLPNNFPSKPSLEVNMPVAKPKPTTTKLYSEALAYLSLPTIGLEQTKDLVRIVSNKVASTKIQSGPCGMSECYYNGYPLNSAWVDLGQKLSNIEAPASVEAKIRSVDLGFDIQKDLHNRLGLFASYRQGEYDLSGEGKDFYAKTGADIDIESWALGLYHRFDRGGLWTMSSIYGGLQDVELTTKDNIVNTNTKGTMFGASIEVGSVFEPQKRLTIEPAVRLGYSFIKYDDISDEHDKTLSYDNVHNIEAEVSAKLEKTWFVNNVNVAKLYIKPSLIKNFGKAGVETSSQIVNNLKIIENQTLVRGELGGSFDFGNGWSGFSAVGYTVGSDYDATDFNLGVNYNW